MANTTMKVEKMMRDLSDTSYRDLMLSFLPSPIKSEDDYDAVQEEMDRLIDKGELSDEENDYLDMLGTLILAYEDRVEKAETYEVRGIEFLQGLLELHGLKQKNLTPIFKTESITFAVLNRKRTPTVEHISRLALYFNVPHALFFEPILTSK